jgi:sugar/nucleoside kinase (ribokinase family)
MVTTFAVVGDLSLDIVVAQSGPRRDGSDVPATIRIGPGGQAANVAVRLARLGAHARLVAPMADDAAGALLRTALAADRIELGALPSTRSTVVIALLDGTGERTMFSDRQTLEPGAVEAELRGAGWVHVSGYVLLDDRTGDAMAELLGSRNPDVRLSVAGGSVPPEPARVSRLRTRLQAAHPDLLLLSSDEAASMLDGRPGRALAAALALGETAPLVIVTDGADGSAAVGGAHRVETDAVELPGPMLDATGSGDAFLAASISHLAASAAWPPAEADLRAAMEAASRLGGSVSRVLGAQGRVPSEPPAP